MITFLEFTGKTDYIMELIFEFYLFNRISKLAMSRFTQVYLHPTFIYKFTSEGKEFFKTVKTLHEFTEKVIRERKLVRETSTEEASEDGVKKRKAFLDLLLDAGSDLTDTDLREEVDTFMFEVRL